MRDRAPRKLVKFSSPNIDMALTLAESVACSLAASESDMASMVQSHMCNHFLVTRLPFPDAFWELREQVAGARACVDCSDGMIFCWFESSVVYCQGECPEPIIMGPGRVRELQPARL